MLFVFFFYINLFNWRLITLQYCIGFAIHQHGSATGIHVFPILNPPSSSLPYYHPSGSSQCTSPKHPVSCIKPGLVIRFTYDIIHVSVPFSQIIPPSPSPTESKRLFYTSVSLLLSRIQGAQGWLDFIHYSHLIINPILWGSCIMISIYIKNCKIPTCTQLECGKTGILIYDFRPVLLITM